MKKLFVFFFHSLRIFAQSYVVVLELHFNRLWSFIFLVAIGYTGDENDILMLSNIISIFLFAFPSSTCYDGCCAGYTCLIAYYRRVVLQLVL